ncbi:hypothetical protein C8R42DRAFT_623420, partial [Lentinula raphanica]
MHKVKCYKVRFCEVSCVIVHSESPPAMSSDRSHKQRPQDVTLPPISQIFNAMPDSSASRGSDLSLPPLRSAHPEENQRSHRSDSTNYRAHDTSYHSPEAPSLQAPRMNRSRYDQLAPSGSSTYPPPPISRGASYSASSSYQPSGMTMPASSAGMYQDRSGSRHIGVPSMSYGPSPYSYAPSPAQSSHYPAPGSGSSRSSDVGSRGDGYSASGHYSSLNPAAGQRPHASDESQSKTNKYECRYCGKGFLRPSALKIHIISHTGDKDYVCPEENCGRRFGVRSNMLRHIRLVHQNSHSQSSGEELSKDD